MKKVMVFAFMVAIMVAGVYFWRLSSSTTESESQEMAPVEAPEEVLPEVTEAKPDLGHPIPGEIVSKAQTFLQKEYGFSLTLPEGWMVVDWTNPPPPQPGQRPASYVIRLEDPQTGSLLDFAVYPYTFKSQYAVEEIFISKIEPPVSGLKLDIQVDEVNELEDMRVRRAEAVTRDSKGAVGRMSAYYYLGKDKFYSFSLLTPESAVEPGDPRLNQILDGIRILG